MTRPGRVSDKAGRCVEGLARLVGKPVRLRFGSDGYPPPHHSGSRRTPSKRARCGFLRPIAETVLVRVGCRGTSRPHPLPALPAAVRDAVVHRGDRGQQG